MNRLFVPCLVLVALVSNGCQKSKPNTAIFLEAKPAPQKSLLDVLIGTWAVRDVGKGQREFTSTYAADGVTENRMADGLSEKEKYRIVDEKTIEYLGPPSVRGTVTILSDNELKITFPEDIVIQLTRKK